MSDKFNTEFKPCIIVQKISVDYRFNQALFTRDSDLYFKWIYTAICRVMYAKERDFDVADACGKAAAPTFLRINLDAILNNIKVAKSFLGKNTGKHNKTTCSIHF